MKAVPSPDLGFQADRSAVFVDDDRVDQRQSLAGSLADFLGGEEEVEDAGANFLGDARARVCHADLRPGVLVAGADGDRALCGGAVPRGFSAIACAALTTRFVTMRSDSVGRQWTGGNSGSKSVTTSATYFHSLRQRVIGAFQGVVQIDRLLLPAGRDGRTPSWSPTMFATCCNSFQRLFDGLGDFAAEVVRGRRRGAWPRCRAADSSVTESFFAASKMRLKASEQPADVGEGVLEESRVVADVLRRRVDFVGDAGGQLSDRLQPLAPGQFGLHPLLFPATAAAAGWPGRRPAAAR